MASEAGFQAAVIDLAHHYGLRVAHFRKARTPDGKRWHTPVGADGKGFPDLVIVGGGGVLYRELKTDTGRQSTEQTLWEGALLEAGEDVDVWRPRDLEPNGGRIKAELAAIRRPSADEIAGAALMGARPLWLR